MGLLDGLRDENPGEPVQRRPRGTKRKPSPPPPRLPRRRKAPPVTTGTPGPDLSWPEHWVLKGDRCRGVTANGVQCVRTRRGATDFCVQHQDNSVEHVLNALIEVTNGGKVSKPRQPKADGESDSKKAARSRSGLKCAPDERRCAKLIFPNTDRERRCTRWTIKVDDEAYDKFCVVHSKDPRAKQARAKGQEKATEAKEKRGDYVSKARRPIFDRELKTQDDVADMRLRLMQKVEANLIGQGNAGILLRALKDVSVHVERFGTHQGAEGGAGVMRLLPGTVLQEADDELDMVMTKEQLEQIEAGLARDEREGREVPVEFDEIMRRYTGFETRKRDRSRNYKGGEE